MSTETIPASTDQALDMVISGLGFLADADATQLPTEALGAYLRTLEQADAIGAVARGKMLAAFDAKDGHLCDGQRTTRAWLVNTTGITRRQAAEHLAVAALAREHPRMLAGLREGQALTKSVALQAAKWMQPIPGQYQDEAEEIVVTAVLAGADLSAVAAIIAEIKKRTAPDQDRDPDVGYGVSLDTTMDGAGVLRGDLSPKCAAMVRSVLDALSAPQGADDLRTKDERYHDALSEAMRRLLASDLLPKRAGQPVKLSRTSTSPSCARSTAAQSSRTSGSPSTGRPGLPTALPPACGPAMAGRGWRATRPGRWPAMPW